MGRAFESATAFTGLNGIGPNGAVGISGWDVSKVTNMRYMFHNPNPQQGVSSFNGDLSQWNTGRVTTFYGMFFSATAFTGADGLFTDVSSVVDAEHMFNGASSMNADLSTWTTTSLTKCSNMFKLASAFTGVNGLNNWDVSLVTSMDRMFFGCTSFNGDISDWDVSAVSTMEEMFSGCTSFNSDIKDWTVSAVTTTVRMFQGATAFSRDLAAWTVCRTANTCIPKTDMFKNSGSQSCFICCSEVCASPTTSSPTPSPTPATVPTSSSGETKKGGDDEEEDTPLILKIFFGCFGFVALIAGVIAYCRYFGAGARKRRQEKKEADKKIVIFDSGGELTVVTGADAKL
jgi:surface protein